MPTTACADRTRPGCAPRRRSRGARPRSACARPSTRPASRSRARRGARSVLPSGRSSVCSVVGIGFGRAGSGATVPSWLTAPGVAAAGAPAVAARRASGVRAGQVQRAQRASDRREAHGVTGGRAAAWARIVAREMFAATPRLPRRRRPGEPAPPPATRPGCASRPLSCRKTKPIGTAPAPESSTPLASMVAAVPALCCRSRFSVTARAPASIGDARQPSRTRTAGPRFGTAPRAARTHRQTAPPRRGRRTATRRAAAASSIDGPALLLPLGLGVHGLQGAFAARLDPAVDEQVQADRESDREHDRPHHDLLRAGPDHGAIVDDEARRPENRPGKLRLWLRARSAGGSSYTMAVALAWSCAHSPARRPRAGGRSSAAPVLRRRRMRRDRQPQRRHRIVRVRGAPVRRDAGRTPGPGLRGAAGRRQAASRRRPCHWFDPGAAEVRARARRRLVVSRARGRARPASAPASSSRPMIMAPARRARTRPCAARRPARNASAPPWPRAQNEVKACYKQALGAAEPNGRVVVTLIYNRDGHVIQAQVDEATVHDERVESCITDHAYAWATPEARPRPASSPSATRIRSPPNRFRPRRSHGALARPVVTGARACASESLRRRGGTRRARLPCRRPCR